MNALDAPEAGWGQQGEPVSTADGDANALRAAVRAVRRGDREAFAHVVERYQHRLFGLALMLTRESSAAEEVAQDALVRAFTHLNAYDERRPLYPWLATIAVRLAQNWLTQRARTVAREARASAQAVDSVAVDPLETLIADEEGRRLWRLVAALPPGERAAVLLYYRQEMSVHDIAVALGVTSGTVKTFLFRARQRLRLTADGAPQAKDGP